MALPSVKPVATDSATDAGADAGPPVVVATGFTLGNAIVVDDANVYFAGSGWFDDAGFNPEIRLVQVPKGGGAPVTRAAPLAATGSGPLLAVDAANVYFCGSNVHTLYVPIAGGNAVDLTPTLTVFADGAQSDCEGLVIDDANIYSGGGNIPTVWSMPKAGGTPVEFAGPRPAPPAPQVTFARVFEAVDGTYAYWLYNGAGSAPWGIEKAPVAGGPPTQIASESPDGGGAFDRGLPYVNENCLVTGGTLYWGRMNGAGTIWSLPVTGGTPTLLRATNHPMIAEAQIATDGTNIYFYQQTPGGFTIEKMPIAGGAQTTVAHDPFGANPGVVGGPVLAVDRTSVYWFSFDGSYGTLYKAPK
jgi:hypothetical protein